LILTFFKLSVSIDKILVTLFRVDTFIYLLVKTEFFRFF
jgi:hypothetical protein